MARQRNRSQHISAGSKTRAPRRKEPQNKGRAASMRLRVLWGDPVWRAAVLEKRKATIRRGPVPKDWTRFGIPNGMTRDQAKWFWRQSKLEASLTMNKLEEAGVIPAAADTSDEAVMARDALHYALTTMRGPVEPKIGLQAAGLVLTYTKAKPASKQDITINKAEEWLAAVTEDNGKDPDTDEGTEGGAEASAD